MHKAIKFQKSSLQRQESETARLKVIRGQDIGVIFVIIANEAYLGRGEESDVVISDLKASRLHAKMTLTSLGWDIRDNGSANGLFLNGKLIKQSKLKNHDAVMIGDTVLEFISADSATVLLLNPPKTIEKLELDQKVMELQRQKIQSLGKGFGHTGAPDRPGLSRPEKSSLGPLPLLLGVGVIAYLFLVESSPPPAPVKKKTENTTPLLRPYIPDVTQPLIQKNAEIYYRIGFREFLQRNYLRAKAQFETTLQIAPGHPLATLYLSRCKSELEQEISDHMESGRKKFAAGKLAEAKGHFEAVLRLLDRDTAHPSYIEAKEQREVVEKSQKGTKMPFEESHIFFEFFQYPFHPAPSRGITS